MKKCNLFENPVQDRSEWKKKKILQPTPIQLRQCFNDDDSINNLIISTKLMGKLGLSRIPPTQIIIHVYHYIQEDTKHNLFTKDDLHGVQREYLLFDQSGLCRFNFLHISSQTCREMELLPNPSLEFFEQGLFLLGNL